MEGVKSLSFPLLRDNFSKQILFLHFIFLFINPKIYSQESKIDSLNDLIKRANGVKRVNLYNELSNYYWGLDIKKQMESADYALKEAISLNYPKGMALALSNKGIAFSYSDEYDSALVYHHKALKVRESINDMIGISNSLDNIGMEFYYKGLYKKALDYHTRSLDSRLNLKFNKGIQASYNNIANDYDAMGDYVKALEYHNKSLQICSTLGDRADIAASLNNIGNCYNSFGDYEDAAAYYTKALKIKEELGNPEAIASTLRNLSKVLQQNNQQDKAISYGERALQLYSSLNSKSNIALSLNNLGEIYASKQNYTLSLDYFKKALQIVANTDEKETILTSNINIASSLLSINKANEAKKYLKSAIALADSMNDSFNLANAYYLLASAFIQSNELGMAKTPLDKALLLTAITKSKPQLTDIYILFSDYYTKQGNYEKALNYYKLHKQYSDSLFYKESTGKITELSIHYETEKKDQQINIQKITLKNKNTTLQYLFTGSGLLLFALVIIIILYHKKNQAYRHLVYQHLNVTEKEKTGSNSIEVGDSLAFENRTLTDEQKTIIYERLIKLVESRAYVEPGITISKLAEMCNTNRTYLSIVINEKYNSNFNSFINRLRIEEAKRILSESKNSNIPLKELYKILGFRSYTSFNDAFRKHIGVTPAFYQKTAKDFQKS